MKNNNKLYLLPRRHKRTFVCHDPEFYADASVGKRHNANREDKYQTKHAQLVDMTVNGSWPFFYTPICFSLQTHFFVYLKINLNMKITKEAKCIRSFVTNKISKCIYVSRVPFYDTICLECFFQSISEGNAWAAFLCDFRMAWWSTSVGSSPYKRVPVHAILAVQP